MPAIRPSSASWKLALSTLALVLAAGSHLVAGALQQVPEATRAALVQQLPARVEALRAGLLASLPGLGFAPATGLVEVQREVDLFGESRARFQQTHQGLPVWGAYALASSDAQGVPLKPRLALQTVTAPVASPTLSADKAIQEALTELNLAPGAQVLGTPSARLVVFPATRTGGRHYAPGATEGQYRMDPSLSVFADPPADAFVPAYAIALRIQDPGQGLLARDLVVDARTGQVLRKDEALRFVEGPVQVSGRSQYSGTVILNAYERADGVVELRDTTRPSLASALPGTLFNETISPSNLVFAAYMLNGVTTNVRYTGGANFNDGFGDGLTFNYLGNYGADLMLGVNGQTEAVDAAYGMQATWDFLKNVLHRDGPSGVGRANTAQVHALLYPLSPYANAYWDATRDLLAFGDGGSGYLPFTALDVVAHEMGHAVMSATADLTYSGESGGLSEANSDIVGTAVKFYAHAGGTGDTVPEPQANADWILGAQLMPVGSTSAGIRSMMKPSDLSTPDAWFDGIDMYGVHGAAGPADRFFYFLAEGSQSGNAKTRSDFLPGGMAGIGVHKAFLIWNRAISAEIADPGTNYEGIRAATEAAATALYGATSPELAAVHNAWAAVNVGPPDGVATVPRLRFDPGPWPGGVDTSSSIDVRSRDAFVGVGSTAPLPKILVENYATPPTLVWDYWLGNVDTAKGILRVSSLNGLGWSSSISVKDQNSPRKAMAWVTPVVLDLDGDGEVDGADLGVLALFAMTGRLPAGDDYMASVLTANVALYQWNRAFAALAATWGK